MRTDSRPCEPERKNNKRGGTALDIGLILGELFSGVTYLFSVEGLKTLVMFVIAGVLIYLAIKKDYEPTLLLPIGFGAILANLPPVIDAVSGQAAASVLGENGFLSVLFNADWSGHRQGNPLPSYSP